MKACSAKVEKELELMKLKKMLAWLTAMAMLGTAALATGCGFLQGGNLCCGN